MGSSLHRVYIQYLILFDVQASTLWQYCPEYFIAFQQIFCHSKVMNATSEQVGYLWWSASDAIQSYGFFGFIKKIIFHNTCALHILNDTSDIGLLFSHMNNVAGKDEFNCCQILLNYFISLSSLTMLRNLNCVWAMKPFLVIMSFGNFINPMVFVLILFQIEGILGF
jgi:hypothetical protein